MSSFVGFSAESTERIDFRVAFKLKIAVKIVVGNSFDIFS